MRRRPSKIRCERGWGGGGGGGGVGAQIMSGPCPIRARWRNGETGDSAFVSESTIFFGGWGGGEGCLELSGRMSQIEITYSISCSGYILSHDHLTHSTHCRSIMLYAAVKSQGRMQDFSWVVSTQRQRLKNLGGSGGMLPGKIQNLEGLRHHFLQFFYVFWAKLRLNISSIIRKNRP